MIRHGATLTIQRIPLSQLVITEHASYFPDKFSIYLDLLQQHPDQDVDPLIVTPSVNYSGIFDIRNGKHRMCASIMSGRHDVLCLVVEEPPQKETIQHE